MATGDREDGMKRIPGDEKPENEQWALNLCREENGWLEPLTPLLRQGLGSV